MLKAMQSSVLRLLLHMMSQIMKSLLALLPK